uniref:Secreted protein n=1 Tax=Panagrellus redivivus TaxID=6233 RepID=A0A7E4VUK4_PANRE
MKFLQLLCIAMLLSAVFAAALNAPNATEAKALLNSHVAKLAELKSEIEKINREGKFEDRGIFGPITALIDLVSVIVGKTA